ncbi:hypothetical protein ACHAWT_009212 [Skeletonema menzelii]
MKVNIALLLLFCAGVNGQAESGDCEYFGISTKADCGAECRSRANGRSSWRVSYDAARNLTGCDCTFETGNDPATTGLPAEGKFTCTRTNETPVVVTNEECPNSIQTWTQCRTHCKELAGNWGWGASYRGRSEDDLTQCKCDYGPNRQNSYTCNRTREDVKSYLRSN